MKVGWEELEELMKLKYLKGNNNQRRGCIEEEVNPTGYMKEGKYVEGEHYISRNKKGVVWKRVHTKV